MASIARSQVEDVLQNMKTLGTTEFNLELEHETQTDKDMVKLVPCRECQRPLVVTTFFAPAKAQCSVCRGDATENGKREATVGQPIPGQTDPAKAVRLTDCLINPQFANALCPVHPDDEEHEMELKSVSHNPHYGPGELVYTTKGVEFRQTAKGEQVMHQCLVCNATVTYSTMNVVQYRRQNEAREKPDTGWPHRNYLAGVRGDAPTRREGDEDPVTA